MTKFATEKFSDIGHTLYEKTREGLSQVALMSTQQLSEHPSKDEAIPQEVRDRIEEVRAMPPEEIDRRLAGLVALALSSAETEELPKVLIDEIHSTAEHMVHDWDERNYTLLSVRALADAYSITHDKEIIDKAVAVVRNGNKGFTDYAPDIAAAVDHAAETGQDFRTSLSAVEDIKAIPLHKAGQNPLPTGHFDKAVPMDAYEDLFHPTIRRPNTPAYTQSGIHKDLRPDGSVKKTN